MKTHIPADVHAAAMTAVSKSCFGKLTGHQRACIQYVRDEGNVGHVLGMFPEKEQSLAKRRIVRGRV